MNCFQDLVCSITDAFYYSDLIRGYFLLTSQCLSRSPTEFKPSTTTDLVDHALKSADKIKAVQCAVIRTKFNGFTE